MKKLYRNRKGLSTVISTILMIMVVMVGMSVAFASVVVYANSYRSGLGSSVMESMVIEDVWAMPDQTVRVYLYNTATAGNLGSNVDFRVNAIYIDGNAVNNIRADAATNPKYGTAYFNEITVKAGAHVTFLCSLPQGITLGAGTHNIAITTQRGSTFKGQFNVVSS